MPKHSLDENGATTVLAELLKNAPVSRDFVAELLKERGCTIPFQLSGRSVTVSSFHMLPNGGEIDLLISDDRNAVIFECKVRDAQKPFQIVGYSNYWVGLTGVRPLMVWLVQRPQQILGAGSEMATVITWNEIEAKFRLNAKRASNADGRKIISFCDWLVQTGICLVKGETTIRNKICRGYEQQHAKRILEAIRDSIPHLAAC
jgi:hypothetical protein